MKSHIAKSVNMGRGRDLEPHRGCTTHKTRAGCEPRPSALPCSAGSQLPAVAMALEMGDE